MKSWLTVLITLMPWLSLPAVAGGATVGEQQEDEKVDKERKKKEEKAEKKERESQQDEQRYRQEMQDDIDARVLLLLRQKYEDPFLEDYITEIGQSLVPKETPPGVLFSFRVLNKPTPNATALPDGRIFINAGLLVFVENEAQLAFVLAHEIGHVTEKHALEALKDAKSFKRGLVSSVFGGLVGGAAGGAAGGKEGIDKGMVAGASFVDMLLTASLNRKQENEADRVGASLSLNRSYDARQGVAFFEKLRDTFPENDPWGPFNLYASHSANEERAKNVTALVDGDLGPTYNKLLSSGDLSLGSGQLKLYASRMIRDTAFDFIDDDRYDMAKRLLDSIVDVRANDPKTLWALGRIYKLVGRTAEDKAKALYFLQRATELDERNMYPKIQRDLGLLQAGRLGPEGMPAAIESLKKYVVGYTTKHHVHPPDIEDMYDYMLSFGDAKWTAPQPERLIVAPVPAEPSPAAAPKPATPAAPKKKPTSPSEN